MEDICEESVAWALAHGASMMVDSADGSALSSHAPMSMVPTKVSRDAFVHAVGLAAPYNLLVDRVARDLEWIYATLAPVLAHDEFTAKLVEVCKKVEKIGVNQRYYLGITRSDYMLHKGTDLLQVELNTIASSFGCLSANVARMHKFLLTRYGDCEFIKSRFHNIEDSLPTNEADVKIPEALAEAVDLQLKLCNKSSSKGTVLFVVQQGEKNSFDQRFLEYGLWESHGVATMRRSLGQIAKLGRVDEDNQLYIGDQHISVVYFRAGYTPDDYHSEREWDARELLERSNAIKCPSIQHHLVGTKKVQQALAAPGVIERFMGEEMGKTLRSSFAGLWSMGDESDQSAKKAIADAIANPENYVVKPQREGGGNNIYGNEVKDVLSNMPLSEQSAFILMQRIFPEEVEAFLIRKGKVVDTMALQELGVYGVVLGNGTEVAFNKYAGQLLRTKAVGVDEGGVATGYSCIDSPYLVG